MTCRDCHFWKAFNGTQDDSGGRCARFPPVVVANGQGVTRDIYPTTLARDWCGELKPRFTYVGYAGSTEY